MTFLAPRCSEALAWVSDAQHPHPWFTAILDCVVKGEGEDEDEAPEDEAPEDEAWHRWLAARWAGPVEPLRLDRDEARALLQDPARPALARYLDDSVDVSAGLWSEEEVADACGDELLKATLQ